MKWLGKGEKVEEINVLVKKAQNKDTDSMEQLLRMFKPKVTAISREYFLVGADGDDLVQEGMIGLYKAITVFNENKNKNFSAFATLCIHRQMQSAVKNANRKKNSPLNNYLPINFEDSDEDDDQLNVLLVDDESDVEKTYLDNELKAVLISRVKNMLTTEQFNLLRQFLNGDSYAKIAADHKLTKKQVDNTLQAIKRKLHTLKGEL